MNTTDRPRRRAASAAMTAGAIAIAGASLGGPALAVPALAAPAGSHAAASLASGIGAQTNRITPRPSRVTLNLSLAAMPQGKLTVSTSTGRVRLTMYGFTPSSHHEVAASVLGRRLLLGTLTANAAGAANWSGSLSSLYQAMEGAGISPPASGGKIPGVQLLILNAGNGTPVIAQTSPITRSGTYTVRAVEPGSGVLPPGAGSITYDPAAHTLSVMVDASGLTPGAHAAHIHTGSCQQQGAVVYPLADYTANSSGAIVHETQTVTGVKAANLTGGWYFNLHQGNSSNITTSNGNPTINFRPLLCSTI
jgi:hypothetical protein